MRATEECVSFAFVTADGAVEVLRAGRDHVSVQLVPQTGVQDPDAGARLLCGAVTDERAHHTRHVQIALDTATPSSGIHLQALRARIGTDVRSITTRRAGSSVMVDLDLLPSATEHRVRQAAVQGIAPVARASSCSALVTKNGLPDQHDTVASTPAGAILPEIERTCRGAHAGTDHARLGRRRV